MTITLIVRSQQSWMQMHEKTPVLSGAYNASRLCPASSQARLQVAKAVHAQQKLEQRAAQTKHP